MKSILLAIAFTLICISVVVGIGYDEMQWASNISAIGAISAFCSFFCKKRLIEK